MPVPSPRNSIRIARGNFADLSANATAFGEGEFIYAIDQDRFYTSASGALVPVGAGVVAAEGIDTLSDVDTSTIPPGVGQVLKWDGTNWTPADDSNTDAVTSVAGKTGDVTLVKADITDFSDADYATAAQGATADSAVQPGDNVSDLTNDAGYITLAEVPGDLVTSVNTQTGDVVLDADDIDDTLTTHKFATAAQLGLADTSVQPGDNVSDLTNDTGYITSAGAPVQSVAGKTGSVTLVKADITDFSDADYATAAQGVTADSAIQPGDNVSDLTNDAGYITLAEVPGDLVTSVAGRTGDVVLTSTDVGLENVDNTSDADKPISTATQGALDLKADLVGGVIPTSQIPAVAITEFLGSVASEAAMLALTGQQGDWCLRTDVAVGYVIVGADPSVIAGWEAFTVPGSAVTSINDQVGTVVLGAADVGALPTTATSDDISEGSTNLYSQWDNATGGINYADGNVGVGTTSFSAGEKLKVTIADSGATSTNGLNALTVESTGDTGISILTSNTSIGSLVFGDPQNGAIGRIRYLHSVDAMFLQTNNAERMRIDPDGNVGIGTTNPGEKLEVNGTIKATDINFTGLATYADDATAGTGGLVAGDVYKTATGELRIKL